MPCGSMEEKTTVFGEESTMIEFDPSCAFNTIGCDCLVVLKPIVPDIAVQSSWSGNKNNIIKNAVESFYRKITYRAKWIVEKSFLRSQIRCDEYFKLFLTFLWF